MQLQLGRGGAAPGEVCEGWLILVGRLVPRCSLLTVALGSNAASWYSLPFCGQRACEWSDRTFVSVPTLLLPPSPGVVSVGRASWLCRRDPTCLGRESLDQQDPRPWDQARWGPQLSLYTLRLEAGELNSGSELGKGLDWRGSGFVSCLSPFRTGRLLGEDWRR